MANAGVVDSAHTVRLLANLHQKYKDIKEHTGDKAVRMTPSNGWKRIAYIVFVILQTAGVIWLIFQKVDVTKEKKLHRYVADLSENEQHLRNNEREMTELETCLDEMSFYHLP